MTENKLGKRLYCLVNRSLSPMQKGIQALHAVVEYGLKYPTQEYFEWANEYKTVIILDGGTSNSAEKIHIIQDNETHNIFAQEIHDGFLGDMENHLWYLKNDLGINVAEFWEPDVNDCLTAIAFIVDERVYDYEKYNFEWPDDWIEEQRDIRYKVWVNEIMGGETNVKLREFLSQFKLAL